MLHQYLALVVRGACVFGLHGSETVVTVLGRLPPPGHGTDSRMKQITSFSMKKAYLLVLKIQPEKYQAYNTSRGYHNALGMGAGGHHPCTLP